MELEEVKKWAEDLPLGELAKGVLLKVIERYGLNVKFNMWDFNVMFGILLASAYYDILNQNEDFWLNGKDIAELILLFKNGKDIQLSANTHTGTQTIKIEKDELKKELVKILNAELIEQFGKLYSELKWIVSVDKEELSDTELQRIIDEESIWEARRKMEKGKEEKHIPVLGRFVSAMLNTYKTTFSKLSQSESYCVLGDIVCLCGNVPSVVNPEDEWDTKSKREKKEIVKGWIKSYQNTQGKNIDIQGGK